jgi:hypothetical protein
MKESQIELGCMVRWLAHVDSAYGPIGIISKITDKQVSITWLRNFKEVPFVRHIVTSYCAKVRVPKKAE